VKAAQAAGCSTLRIILTEILPNILNHLVVVITLEMARAILLEAALSFLGLGVQPPLPSWGLMVSEGKEFMLFSPWVITIPGVALFLLVLGLLIWDRFAVVMRSSTQQIRSSDYISAAKAIGCSTPRILFTELMPNVLNNLIVVATLEIAHAVLLEAALSFLGMGVQPPLPSWGLMVSEGKEFMLFSPWIIMIPGFVLSLLVLSVNLMGDGIRDITAPEGRS